MFKWLNKQGVEHTEKGFVVQCTGRFTTEYIEGSKLIIIHTADQGRSANGKHFDMVHADNFEKWEDGTAIDKDKQEEIKRNYIEAMAFQNIDIIINDSPTPHYTIDDLP